MIEPGEEKDGAEENEEDDGLGDNTWAKKMNLHNTAQRKKKQTTMTWKKPNHSTVIYIKSRGS